MMEKKLKPCKQICTVLLATSVLGGGKNDTQTKRKRGLFDIGDFGSHGGGMFVLLRMCFNLLH